MIKLNFSDAVNELVINKYQDKVQKIHTSILNKISSNNQYLGWQKLPVNYDKDTFLNIKEKSEYLKNAGIEILVVISIGGFYLGSKAAIEFINGSYNMKKNMEILFVGESMSSTDLAQKLAYVQNKKIAINVISESGEDLEPSLAFRLFKSLLKDKMDARSNKFIFVTTNKNSGPLIKQATNNKWSTFYIPKTISGNFSALTAAGLFPMACVGLSIDNIIKGSQIGRKLYSNDFTKNDAYKYAVSRYVLSKKYKAEALITYEPQMSSLTQWWKHLFATTNGKNQKGLFPISAIFPTDLHALGQFIQAGPKILFETIITVKEPNLDVKVIPDKDNPKDLFFLNGKSIHSISKRIFKNIKTIDYKLGKVPNIHLEIGKMDELHFGQLIYFFEKACIMSAYLLGVNPFSQSGMTIYKSNIFKLLGHSDYKNK